METIINAAQLIYKGNAMSKSRTKEIVNAKRAVCAYLISHKYTQERIARIMPFNRSNISNHYKIHKGFMEVDKEYREKYNLFVETIEKQNINYITIENEAIKDIITDIKSKLSIFEIELLKNLL